MTAEERAIVRFYIEQDYPEGLQPGPYGDINYSHEFCECIPSSSFTRTERIWIAAMVLALHLRDWAAWAVRP